MPARDLCVYMPMPMPPTISMESAKWKMENDKNRELAIIASVFASTFIIHAAINSAWASTALMAVWIESTCGSSK